MIPAQVSLINSLNAGVPVFGLTYVNDGAVVPELCYAILAHSRRRFLTKERDSAFDGSNLDIELRNIGVDTLVLAGINATGCVLKTALSALDLRYKVITALDLIADPLAFDSTVPYDPADKGRDFYSSECTLFESHLDLIDSLAGRTD